MDILFVCNEPRLCRGGCNDEDPRGFRVIGYCDICTFERCSETVFYRRGADLLLFVVGVERNVDWLTKLEVCNPSSHVLIGS